MRLTTPHSSGIDSSEQTQAPRSRGTLPAMTLAVWAPLPGRLPRGHAPPEMGGGSSSLCTDLFGLASSPAEQTQFSVEGKQYDTVRLLGEGGFAFVYLVRDDAGRMYALKKARRLLCRAKALCVFSRRLHFCAGQHRHSHRAGGCA